MEKVKKIVHSTESGRLYIKTSDFFEQKEVQEMIDELMKSSVYRDIKARKSNSKS